MEKGDIGRPLTTKAIPPPPLCTRFAEFTVTAAPTAVSVTTVAGLEVPSATAPKLTVGGLVLKPAPLPERFAVASTVEPVSKDSVPLDGPTVLGVKVMKAEVLVPDLIVMGNVIPLKPKPLPVKTSEEIVTSPALAERVAVCGWLVVPTLTLENVKVEGLIDSWPLAVKLKPLMLALDTVTC